MKLNTTYLLLCKMAGVAIIAAVIAAPGRAQSPGESDRFQAAKVIDGKLHLLECTVKVIAEPLLAAAESGRLIQVPKPGDKVTEGEVIAETDSTIAQYQERIAYLAYMMEKVKLESDIEKRFAEKQAQVDDASYRDAVDANDKRRGAISPNELRRRKFQAEAGLLRIEKAEHDHNVARAGALVKLEEKHLAAQMVEMHQIESPVTGVVNPDPPPRQVGEWVRPGDPIAMVTQLDRMRVIGNMSLRFCAPKDAAGQEVIIKIPTSWDSSGKPSDYVTRDAIISYVGEKMFSNKTYEVWAEVDNSDELIKSGMVDVEMVFQSLP